MSKKSPRIAALIAHRQGGKWPAPYLGYFDCFNAGWYFEAHDVLEELWLANGRTAPNYAFYKGLIQFTGAFVHLQKGRLRPAVALFNLAETNLQKYPATHDACDLDRILKTLRDWRSAVLAGDFATNPLPQSPPPRLRIPGECPPGSHQPLSAGPGPSPHAADFRTIPPEF